MGWHEMKYRVPYADTDQMGVVYYANYLEYFERSRTEMMRDAGMPYSELEKLGVFLPVSEAHCHYHASAHYDENLTFRSQVVEIRGVRLRIASEVWFEDKMLVKGEVILACVNTNRKPVKPPRELVQACSRFEAEENSGS